MLETGQKAPDFAAKNHNHSMVRLSDYVGHKNVVLYFYPKANTPGCTMQSKGFSDLADDFAELDTAIIGVSRDTSECQRNFKDRNDLTNIELLSDAEGTISEAYGAWQEKDLNGHKVMGIVRSTFIIDKSGNLAFVEYNVSPNEHAEEVLHILKHT